MKYFFSFLFIATLFSCTEKIEFDLNNDDFKRVVVEGFITDQTKSHLVKLSYTSSYYQDQVPEPVSGAMVSISDGTTNWELTENPVGSGLYYTDNDVHGTVGANHILTIEHDGEVYTGVDFMNPVAVLDSIAVERVEEEENGEIDVYHSLMIWTQETPGPGDYYRWRVLRNGVSETDSLNQLQWSDDAFYDGAYLAGYEFYTLYDAAVGDTITMEQMSISSVANDVFLGLNLETFWRGGLFDSAPSNVITNMSNGAVGFFGASSVSAKTTYVIE